LPGDNTQLIVLTSGAAQGIEFGSRIADEHRNTK
jgi:hypothetical protein